jgi:hypothetical protein
MTTIRTNQKFNRVCSTPTPNHSLLMDPWCQPKRNPLHKVSYKSFFRETKRHG